jgi:hypothetical protein
MITRLVHDETVLPGGRLIIELPKDATLDSVDVLVTAGINDGGTTPWTEPGFAHNMLAELELTAGGNPIFDRLPGRSTFYLAACLMGERMEEIFPVGAAADISTLYRLHLADPRGILPLSSAFNLRRLENFTLRLTAGVIADLAVPDGTPEYDDVIRVRVFYNVAMGAGGNVVAVNKLFDYVLNGAEQIFDWREANATLRAMLIEQFTAGSPVEGIIDTVGLTIDGTVKVLDTLPMELLRARTPDASQLDQDEVPVGLAYIDLDPRTHGDALASLDSRRGSNVQLNLTGTAASVARITRRQYVPLRKFLSR